MLLSRLAMPASVEILVMVVLERNQTANAAHHALETQLSSVGEDGETLSTRLTNVSLLLQALFNLKLEFSIP